MKQLRSTSDPVLMTHSADSQQLETVHGNEEPFVPSVVNVWFAAA
jgi:hypothetical protein